MKKIGLCALALLLSLQASSFAIEEDYDPIYMEPDEETTTFFSKIKKDEIYTLSNFKESSIGASANVDAITRRDIERQNNPSTLTNLLNDLGSVTTQTANGSDGAITTVRMRGTDRVRMTIDGIRADRPSFTSPGVNTQFIMADDLERIEVIKGPQGNVAGTNASGGVVSMQTRRGEGPFKVELGSDMGNYGTFKERFAIMGGSDAVDYYLSTTWYKTDGGLRKEGIGRMPNDRYQNFSLVSNVGARLFDDRAELRNIFRMSNATKGIGTYGDINDYGRNVDVMENVSFSHFVNDIYNYNFRFGVYHNDTNTHYRPDYLNPQDEKIYLSSTRLNFMTQHDFRILDWNTLSIGYNLEGESMDSTDTTYSSPYSRVEYDGSTIQNDVYINDVINIKDILFIRGGARLVANNDYGTYVTPNASTALVLPTFKLKGAKTKFRGSFGQSVNNPTLYQRYVKTAWTRPNPDLEAEKLTGWDAGVEQSFFDEKLKLDFGWFKNDYKNYINYDMAAFPGFYYNVDKAKTNGFEGKITIEPNDIFKLVANYTYTDSEDSKTLSDLPAVPRNRYNTTLYFTPFEWWNLYAGLETASSRYTSSGDPKGRTKGYVDARIGTSIRLFKVKNLSTYLRANIYNLFNQNICMYKDAWSGYQAYYGPKLRYNIGLFFEFGGKKKDKDKDRV